MVSQRLQVLAIENKKGVSKKGSPYDMDMAQCVIHEQTGPVSVGEMILPKDHTCKAGGFYEVLLKLGRSFDGKLSGVVESLRPSQPFSKVSP